MHAIRMGSNHGPQRNRLRVAKHCAQEAPRLDGTERHRFNEVFLPKCLIAAVMKRHLDYAHPSHRLAPESDLKVSSELFREQEHLFVGQPLKSELTAYASQRKQDNAHNQRGERCQSRNGTPSLGGGSHLQNHTSQGSCLHAR